MRDMVYNLPILTPPRWVRSRTTPIALKIYSTTVGLLDHLRTKHRILEAAGPQVLSYQQQQFERFMAVSDKRRRLIGTLSTRWISVWF